MCNNYIHTILYLDKLRLPIATHVTDWRSERKYKNQTKSVDVVMTLSKENGNGIKEENMLNRNDLGIS
jgi:hypothetical protein